MLESTGWGEGLREGTPGHGGGVLVSGSKCILRQEPAPWRVSADSLPLQMLGPRPHLSGTSGSSRS